MDSSELKKCYKAVDKAKDYVSDAINKENDCRDSVVNARYNVSGALGGTPGRNLESAVNQIVSQTDNSISSLSQESSRLDSIYYEYKDRYYEAKNNE